MAWIHRADRSCGVWPDWAHQPG